MRRLALIIVLAALLTTPCLAAGISAEQREAFGVPNLEDSLPGSARDVLGDARVEEALDAEGFVSRLWRAAGERLGESLREAAAGILSVIAIALLCGLAGALAEGESERYVTLGGALAIGAASLSEAGSCLTSATNALYELNDLSKALLPCLTAASVASGAAGSAAAKYAATALFFDMLLTASRSLALPLLYACLAASVAAACLESPALESAAALMKWLCGALLGLLTTAFTVYLSITGAVTGPADALAAKAAKTAISAALPVVGGIISDAAETVVAGAGLLRGAVGAFGLVAVAAVCLAPFLALAARYVLFKGAAVAASAFASKRLGTLIGRIGGVFGMALGLVGAGALMLFLAIISLVKAVTG